MTNGNEDTLQFDVLAAFTFGGLDAHAGDTAVIAQHLFECVIPLYRDIVFCQQLVLQDLLGAQAVTTVDQGDMLCDMREIQCFFHSGIAATDNGDTLALVKETVTGGAGGDALAHERFL